jgi:rubrerythrin
MHDMTAANLRSAFGGESMAHMRYGIWGDAADKEGFKNVARLFRAVSFAETVHATSHFKTLGKVAGDFTVLAGAGFGLSKTADHLAGAIGGENFEVTEMYPAYIAAAREQGEKDAERSLSWAMAAEKIHLEMYKSAKKQVDAGKDAKFGPIQVCGNCGHTIEGEAPDKCPVCGVPKKMFKAFE